MKKRALSVRQPWAWLIVNGYKDIENRSWEPPKDVLGKRLLIHAGRAVVEDADYVEFKNTCKKHKIVNYPKSPENFDYGAVIGSVTVEGFAMNSSSDWASEGSVHWMLKGAKKMKPKIARGQLGIFSVDL